MDPGRCVNGNFDVFSDGSVVMIATPGHIPGHSLLVRLRHMDPVLLTGDLYYYAAQYDTNALPKHEDNQATLASFAHFHAPADQLHATVIIRHEFADIATLPTFRRAAD